MATVVAIEVVASLNDADVSPRVRRALSWFAEVEAHCSRFEQESEVVALCRRPGEPVTVSAMLFHVLDVAVAVARASNGAFDPTVGAHLHSAGFRDNHRGGQAPVFEGGAGATFRDILLDNNTQTVTLRRPVWLDLGGVAKGFAIDLAAAELAPSRNFAINAGGDLFLGGRNADDGPWRIGIRDPHENGCVLGTFEVSDVAVCTSGGYERPRVNGDGHHLVVPSTGCSPTGAASVTAVAASAALADAMSTAVFVLGTRRGQALLRRSGVEGLIVGADGRIHATPGFPEFKP